MSETEPGLDMEDKLTRVEFWRKYGLLLKEEDNLNVQFKKCK